MAKRVDTVAATGKRLRTKAACEHLAGRLGRPVSRSTLFAWCIPHVIDGRDAIYLEPILDQFADQRIAQVGQQVFSSSPRKAA